MKTKIYTVDVRFGSMRKTMTLFHHRNCRIRSILHRRSIYPPDSRALMTTVVCLLYYNRIYHLIHGRRLYAVNMSNAVFCSGTIVEISDASSHVSGISTSEWEWSRKFTGGARGPDGRKKHYNNIITLPETNYWLRAWQSVVCLCDRGRSRMISAVVHSTQHDHFDGWHCHIIISKSNNVFENIFFAEHIFYVSSVILYIF